MKTWKLWLGVIALAAIGQAGAAETPQRITALERSQGWKMLFDGKSLVDWRGYQQNKVPKNWSVVDGSLVASKGTALVTDVEFGDFELIIDWKAADGGQAAVYFRVDEDVSPLENSGPVMHLTGRGVAMGSNGLSAPKRDVTFQPDVWYRTRIVVFGNQVDYYDGSDQLASYTLGSTNWRSAVAGSELSKVKGYGTLRHGRIVISGDQATFRNIKIKPL